MDEVFKALADPSRRLLLDSLNARDGQSLRQLCTNLSMARQSVSKHLAVLESADLVRTVWRGREKLHYLNAGPITDIAEQWMKQCNRAHGSAAFRYTTYVRTTPARLWQAITDLGHAHRDKVIVESEPYRRLVFTFHTVTPGGDAADQRSTVCFEVEPVGDQVKLTLIHYGFETAGSVPATVSESWPLTLADLKTDLERPGRPPVGPPISRRPAEAG